MFCISRTLKFQNCKGSIFQRFRISKKSKFQHLQYFNVQSCKFTNSEITKVRYTYFPTSSKCQFLKFTKTILVWNDFVLSCILYSISAIRSGSRVHNLVENWNLSRMPKIILESIPKALTSHFKQIANHENRIINPPLTNNHIIVAVFSPIEPLSL